MIDGTTSDWSAILFEPQTRRLSPGAFNNSSAFLSMLSVNGALKEGALIDEPPFADAILLYSLASTALASLGLIQYDYQHWYHQ